MTNIFQTIEKDLKIVSILTDLSMVIDLKVHTKIGTSKKIEPHILYVYLTLSFRIILFLLSFVIFSGSVHAKCDDGEI